MDDLSKADGVQGTPPSESSHLEEVVQALAHNFASHPGFVWTRTGFEILHADWPAYPLGHGLRPTLQCLAEFPVGTHFYPLDEIDDCTLFIVGRKPEKDPFSSRFLHVAVWNVDIRECSRRGYVAGRDDDTDLDRLTGAITLTAEGARVALIHELTESVDSELLAAVDDLLCAA